MLLQSRSRKVNDDSTTATALTTTTSGAFLITEWAHLTVLYLYVVAAHSDADLSQVFEQRGHHLSHPLPLVVGHLLQLLQL